MLHYRSSRGYTWAAGSYVDAFLASVVMMIPFGLAFYWVYFVDTTLLDHYGEDVLLTVGVMLMGAGWMMVMLNGMATDLLPLIHKVATFDETTMKLIMGSNIAGQAFLLMGVFSGNVDLFRQLGTIGATLIALQLGMILPPAFKMVRSGLGDEITSGPWVSLPALFLPFLGAATLITWLFIDVHVVRQMYIFLLLDFFWGMIAFTFILEHFGRRLGWFQMSRQRLMFTFVAFLLACAVHGVALYLVQSHTVDDHRLQVTYVLPLATIFLLSKPVTIWRKVLKGEHCSALILGSHSWIVATSCVAIAETVMLPEDTGLRYSRFMFIVGIATMGLWGSGYWLHSDHKHIPVVDKGEGWLAVVMLNLALFGQIYLVFHELGLIGEQYEALVSRSIPGLMLAAYLSTMVWWLAEVFYRVDEWHRIPLFYGTLHHDPDPYQFRQQEQE